MIPVGPKPRTRSTAKTADRPVLEHVAGANPDGEMEEPGTSRGDDHPENRTCTSSSWGTGPHQIQSSSTIACGNDPDAESTTGLDGGGQSGAR
jgi:hypothetical protein